MSVFTDITNHENGGKGGSRTAPTGGYFQRNLSCSLAACTTSNEKCMRSGSGQPQGLPLQRICRDLFSYQSFMSAVTDTTNHENGGKGDSRKSPLREVIFRGISHAALRPAPTSNENVCGRGSGQPQGLPLQWVCWGLFRTNRSCRLSPTPPIMKMAVRAIRESPLREVGRGYFQRNLSCSLRPAHRGMKMYAERRRATTRVAPTTGLLGSIFVPMTGIVWGRNWVVQQQRAGFKTRLYQVTVPLLINT